MNNDRLKFRVWTGKEFINTTPHEQNWYTSENKVAWRKCADVEAMYKEVEQCTGLRDKDGTLIFEGDILRGAYKKEPKEVRWINACFHLVRKDNFGPRHFALSPKVAVCMKVIGNIHQNPELLK